MTRLELDYLKQKISLYDHMISNGLVFQNINNFNDLKEEIFTYLMQEFKQNEANKKEDRRRAA
jgi:hypothetical protein